MIVNIKNNNYELKWGLQAINELDNQFQFSLDYGELQSKFGAGLTFGVQVLSSDNVMVIVKFLRAGLKHIKGRPFSDDDIESYLIQRVERDGDLDTLVREMQEDLKSAPLTKNAMKEVEMAVVKEENKDNQTPKKK